MDKKLKINLHFYVIYVDIKVNILNRTRNEVLQSMVFKEDKKLSQKNSTIL